MIPWVREPHKWHEENGISWIYGRYKARTLSIRLLDNGTYKPLVNGSNWIADDNTKEFTLPTLKEAQDYLFNYIDKLISDEDKVLSDKFKKHVLTSYIERNK